MSRDTLLVVLGAATALSVAWVAVCVLMIVRSWALRWSERAVMSDEEVTAVSVGEAGSAAPYAAPVHAPLATDPEPFVLPAPIPVGAILDSTPAPNNDVATLAAELHDHVIDLSAHRKQRTQDEPRRRRRHGSPTTVTAELAREIDEALTHGPHDARDVVVTEREPTSEIRVRLVPPDTSGHPAATSHRRGA